MVIVSLLGRGRMSGRVGDQRPLSSWLSSASSRPPAAAGIDGVVIAAATDAHPELIIAAADTGVPVLCEKPVARTIGEGVAVGRRVAATGVPIQIGYPRRFDPGFTAARAAVASSELGWLHTVRSTTLDPPAPRRLHRGLGRYLP